MLGSHPRPQALFTWSEVWPGHQDFKKVLWVIHRVWPGRQTADLGCVEAAGDGGGRSMHVFEGELSGRRREVPGVRDLRLL